MRQLLWSSLVLSGLAFQGCASQPKSEVKADKMASNVKASLKIKTKEVVYAKHNGKDLVGYVAEPVNAKNAPVVLVVHEWWGQTDDPRRRAEMLARLGYVAVAVDMYGNRSIAEHPKDAQAFMMETLKDMPGGEERFKKAMEFAKGLKSSDPNRLAAIGYCYGAGLSYTWHERAMI